MLKLTWDHTSACMSASFDFSELAYFRIWFGNSTISSIVLYRIWKYANSDKSHAGSRRMDDSRQFERSTTHNTIFAGMKPHVYRSSLSVITFICVSAIRSVEDNFAFLSEYMLLMISVKFKFPSPIDLKLWLVNRVVDLSEHAKLA